MIATTGISLHNQSRQIANIQALRGIAALLVFGAHIVGAERDYGGGEQLLPNFLHMGVSGVDLFFLISGFIMVYVTAPRDQPGDHHGGSGRRQSLGFLYRRAARIYPLYWVLTLALIGLYAGKKILFGEDTPIDNYVTSFLLVPDHRLPIIPVGWTLIHEMYFYIMFSLFMLVHRRFLPVLLVGWGLIILGGWLAGWREINAWLGVIFSPLTFEFLAGAACALACLRKQNKQGKGKSRPRARWLPKLMLGVGGVVLIILFIPMAEHLYPASLTSHWQRAALFTLPYALVLYGAVTIEWDHARIAPGWLVRLGDASYALYLIHIPMFLVTGKLLSLVGGPGILDNIALIILYLISGIGAALLVHRYIEKPLNALAKRVLANHAK